MLFNTYEPWKFAFSSENEEIKENSYGIIGVPFDSTTSYHSGARLGPIVVREASFGFPHFTISVTSMLFLETAKRHHRLLKTPSMKFWT